MESTEYRERYLTREQIRQNGAIGNLAEGISIRTHGLDTRLIAWPGNGFQTQAVHVLTVPAGQASDSYAYDMAEEAMVCFKGKGQVYLRGGWVDVAPGDIAYFPATVERAVRNAEGNTDDFVLVTSISPPQFDLYSDAGFYDPTHKVMNLEAIDYAKINAPGVQYDATNEMAFHDTSPEVRAWNLSNDEIRRGGALFNAFYGGALEGLETGGSTEEGTAAMLLILFAGYGTGATGFNFSWMTPGMTADIHTHPVSDECVVNWWGGNSVWVGDRWVQSKSYDCILAPSGVRHGGVVPADATVGLMVGGLAAPPQLDLLINSGYYSNGRFTRPEFTRLAVPGST
ncbi:MAG TPA: cupin domain-containing protein [Longimicrobiaceae bacterium]|nr:cupin domain-containing protein [Longimicrobiaceae bacterium]